MLNRPARPHRATRDPRFTRCPPGPYLSRQGSHRHRPRPARPRPGTGAVRAGDILVVPKLDRLARSVPDACPPDPHAGQEPAGHHVRTIEVPTWRCTGWAAAARPAFIALAGVLDQAFPRAKAAVQPISV